MFYLIGGKKRESKKFNKQFSDRMTTFRSIKNTNFDFVTGNYL